MTGQVKFKYWEYIWWDVLNSTLHGGRHTSLAVSASTLTPSMLMWKHTLQHRKWWRLARNGNEEGSQCTYVGKNFRKKIQLYKFSFSASMHPCDTLIHQQIFQSKRGHDYWDKQLSPNVQKSLPRIFLSCASLLLVYNKLTCSFHTDLSWPYRMFYSTRLV